jgi:predicted transcriptional regulator
MYISSASLKQFRPLAGSPTNLPPEVRALFPRSQQIAAIVYDNGFTTAREIECRLADSTSNATVRSTLTRLVHKGILLQRRFGKRGAFVYAPALAGPYARELALKQFAADFCGGSLELLAEELSAFFAGALQAEELLASYDRAPPREVRSLRGRTREVTDIVYRGGAASIKDIQGALSRRLTTSCVRTLLNRLHRRGIVRKRQSIRHREVVYLPAIINRDVRRVALRRLIDDRFAGSSVAALHVILLSMHAGRQP